MPIAPQIPSFDFLTLHLVYGLMGGLVYAVFALGLTVIFSISKTVNFAHGEFYAMGGYVFFLITTYFGLNNYLALALTAVAVMAAGFLVERSIIRPAYVQSIERAQEYGVLVTFGLLIVIQNTNLQIFGPYSYRPPPFWGDLIRIGPLSIFGDRIVAAVTSMGILLLLLVFFKKTWTGMAMRAAAQNKLGAGILGISLERMMALSFMLGTGLAAVSGALLSYVFLVYPTMGVDPVIKAFAVIVIGGMGSLLGAAIGGIVLGLTEGIATAFLGASYVTAYGYIALILFLIFRPNGFFGERVRRV